MVALLHTLIVVVVIHGVSVSRMMNLGVLQLVVPDGVHSSAAGTAGPKLADIVRPPPPEPTADGEAAPGAGAGLGAGAGAGGGAAAAAVAVATAFADNIATESVDTGALVPSAESIAWAATAGRIRSHDSGFAWSKAVYTMNSGLTSTPSALRALEADKDLADDDDDDDDDDDNDGGKATTETAAVPAPISMAAPPVPGGAPSSPLVISDNDESDTETDEDEDDEDDSSDSDTGEVVASTAVKVADA